MFGRYVTKDPEKKMTKTTTTTYLGQLQEIILEWNWAHVLGRWNLKWAGGRYNVVIYVIYSNQIEVEPWRFPYPDTQCMVSLPTVGHSSCQKIFGIPVKSKDKRMVFRKDYCVLVRVYKQQFQGTVLWMVGEIEGKKNSGLLDTDANVRNTLHLEDQPWATNIELSELFFKKLRMPS